MLQLPVHFLPVPDPDHQDDQAVVFHPVDDPIGPHPEPEQPFTSLDGHGAGGSWILGQGVYLLADAFLGVSRQGFQIPKGGRGELD